VEDPTDSNFIICKDKTTGKKVRKPKPADWPKTKMEACDTYQKATDVVVVEKCWVHRLPVCANDPFLGTSAVVDDPRKRFDTVTL